METCDCYDDLFGERADSDFLFPWSFLEQSSCRYVCAFNMSYYNRFNRLARLEHLFGVQLHTRNIFGVFSWRHLQLKPAQNPNGHVITSQRPGSPTTANSTKLAFGGVRTLAKCLETDGVSGFRPCFGVPFITGTESISDLHLKGQKNIISELPWQRLSPSWRFLTGPSRLPWIENVNLWALCNYVSNVVVFPWPLASRWASTVQHAVPLAYTQLFSSQKESYEALLSHCCENQAHPRVSSQARLGSN